MTDKLTDAEKAQQDILSHAYEIAKSLQEDGNPTRSMQILSVATGLSICAFVKDKNTISHLMQMFTDQVNHWCRFEESEGSASWLKKSGD